MIIVMGLGRIFQTSVTDFLSVICTARACSGVGGGGWGGSGGGGGGGGDRIQLYQELHLHFFLHKNEHANLSMH